MNSLTGGYDNSAGTLEEVLLLHSASDKAPSGIGYLALKVQGGDIQVYTGTTNFKVEKGNIALIWLGGVQGRVYFKGAALVTWTLAA